MLPAALSNSLPRVSIPCMLSCAGSGARVGVLARVGRGRKAELVTVQRAGAGQRIWSLFPNHLFFLLFLTNNERVYVCSSGSRSPCVQLSTIKPQRNGAQQKSWVALSLKEQRAWKYHSS